jgi:histidinol-phosphatase
VTLKADQTPVTQADREAEQAIVARLSAAFPDVGFLGEEFGAQGAQGRRWIVDPIDGTKNFVRGIPYWATLIGLEEDGRSRWGRPRAGHRGPCGPARRGLRQREPPGCRWTGSAGDPPPARTTSGGFPGRYWDGFLRLVDLTDRQRGFATTSPTPSSSAARRS